MPSGRNASFQALAPVQRLVECPNCGQPGFMDTWPSFASGHVQPAGLLAKGRLFKYLCPVCGAETTVVYECLFRDEPSRTAVLFCADEPSRAQCRQKIDALANHDRQVALSNRQFAGYQYRGVASAFELCEKARILAAGYDDRAIELLKVAIKRGMLKEGIIGAHDILIYERTMPDGGISFVVTGEIPGDVVGVAKGYEYVQGFLEGCDEQLEGQYFFDHAWAVAFLP